MYPSVQLLHANKIMFKNLLFEKIDNIDKFFTKLIKKQKKDFDY
jgi:hypothetical protein